MAAWPCRARWNGVSNENRKARSEILLDIRTYRVKPGRLKAHFEVYEKYGKPAQTRHLGQPLVYLRTETGDPNEYVHIWVYENAADREKKRAAMQADPGWQDYQKRSAELGALVSQTNKLMTRSEEHTSELQSLMRISSAVFCLKKTNKTHKFYTYTQ